MTQSRTDDVNDGGVDRPVDEADEQLLLLQRLAQGERMAFWAIWILYREELFTCCLRWMGGNREEAEDALSSASLKAWKHLPEHAQDIVNVKAWLLRLLRNHCIDIRRTHKRHDHVMQMISTSPHQKPEWQLPDCESPEDTVHRQALFQDVRHAIDDLPPVLHDTAKLRLVRDLSYREIATQLEVSPENARKRAQQARSILRTSLSGYYSGDSRSVGITPSYQEHRQVQSVT